MMRVMLVMMLTMMIMMPMVRLVVVVMMLLLLMIMLMMMMSNDIYPPSTDVTDFWVADASRRRDRERAAPPSGVFSRSSHSAALQIHSKLLPYGHGRGAASNKAAP